MDSKEHLGSLFTAEDKYRLLVDAVTDYAIYMLDPQGVIASWNTGAQRLKGYTAQDVIGQHFSLFYSEPDRSAGLPENGLSIAAQKGRFANEGWRLRKDGSRFMAHVIIDAIRAPDGSLTGFAKVTRDITERMETQKALDVAREELLQAQKMEAVGRLTGGIAHDFNNFLTIILISLKMARKRVSDSPEVLRFVDNAIQGAERGASMTQRMLAFSSRQPLHLEVLGLAQLVAGMRELLQRSIGPQVTISTQAAPDLPTVRADAHQLETLLLNLVLNARDAMPGGGDITISTRRPHNQELPAGSSGPGPEWVVLEVADAGVGMDAQTLGRAIEPFFTTKAVGKGTGLGLSMVHGITEQLGGKLKLLSEPGKGTRAQLWLPAWLGGETLEVGSGPAPAADAVLALRVLAVDDDALVLSNTCALLEEIGHQPLRASSAAQALVLLEQQPVDLLITDHAMPVMTGSELIEQVQTRYPGLPVILTTGYLGMDQPHRPSIPLLAKPYSEQDLIQLISLAINGAKDRP